MPRLTIHVFLLPNLVLARIFNESLDTSADMGFPLTEMQAPPSLRGVSSSGRKMGALESTTLLSTVQMRLESWIPDFRFIIAD